MTDRTAVPTDGAPAIHRNLGMELVRVTEAAALSAAPFMGRGDGKAGDAAAVDAMRAVLATIEMNGVVVIGGLPDLETFAVIPRAV